MNAFPLFRIAGIQVSASPFYLFLLWILTQHQQPRDALISCAAITVSLLVHELGHALTARYLRLNPSIMLHGFGGMTMHERSRRSVEEGLIVAMGPASGLLLGLLMYGAVMASRSFATLILLHGPLLVALNALLFTSVSWNLLNLLPLWPLDGGQLFRLGANRVLGGRRAVVVTHGLALFLLALFAAFMLRMGQPYMLLLLFSLGMQNYTALRGGGSDGPAPASQNPRAAELVADAKEAFAQEQYKDAARLAHQARSFQQLSPAMLDEIWSILGCSNAALGEHEEALPYLRRAKPTERVQRATQECLAMLDRQDELAEIQTRWQANKQTNQLGRWLGAALGFIFVAIALVFITGLRHYAF